MRALILLTTFLALNACGKSDTPPDQTASTPATPAVVAVPAPAPETVATPAAATDAESVAPLPLAEATATPAPVPVAEPVAPLPLAEATSTPAPAPAEAAAVEAPAVEPVAPLPLADATSTPAPAAEPVAPLPLAEATAVPADAPYQVVDGRIDADTVEGWKIYRGIGTCATCHGPVGQGGVGPALVDSLKEAITKELFVDVVANGRAGTMMKPFGGNPNVMNNIDRIYAYLKARADGVLGPENLLKYPLGKIE